MIILYRGSGSQEIDILSDALSKKDWANLRINATKLLRARKQEKAAKHLEEIPFEIKNGTNHFGDEFAILYWRAPLEKYVKIAEIAESNDSRQNFLKIAQAIDEVGTYIRFIAVELETEDSFSPVESPNLQITTDLVERALKDAEQLLLGQGAISGIDRVHTALHGFLKTACEKNSIPYQKDASITIIFKSLKESHPAFSAPISHEKDIDRTLKALSSVVDSLNTLRNRGSMAHANETLLEEPEAMLVINTVRTLLHYLNSKLSKSTP